MKTNRLRLLWVLSLFIYPVLFTQAMSEYAVKIGFLKYLLDEKTMTARAFFDKEYDGPSVYTIPETVSYKGKDYVVTSVSNSEQDDGEKKDYLPIRELTIPKTVTQIWRAAFFWSNIEKIIFLGDVDIQENAFARCTKLKEVSFERIRAIGEGAFWGCLSLESIELDACTVSNSAFYGCTGLTCTTLSNVQSIEAEAFYGCTGLTSITLSNVQSIGHEAFKNCERLKELNIESLLDINDNKAISDIGMGFTLMIDGTAFDQCKSLSAINIPAEGIIRFEKGAFLETEFWDQQPDGVVYITPRHVLGYKGDNIGDIRIADGAIDIADYAFYECKSLKKVVLPNSMKSIGVEAFAKSGIEYIDFPSALTNIGTSAFAYCTELKEFHFPESLVFSGFGIIQYCSKLETLVLPKDIKLMSDIPFAGCSSLKKIIAPSITPYTTAAAYQPEDLFAVPLYVPRESILLYKAANFWRNFVIIRAIEDDDSDVFLNILQENSTLQLAIDSNNPVVRICLCPNDGWKLHRLYLNQTDVTAEVAENGTYVTPAITTTSTLKAVYEKVGSNAVKQQEQQDVQFHFYDGTVEIEGAGSAVPIIAYTTDGRTVAQVKSSSDGSATLVLSQDNTYIIKMGSRTFKLRI